MANLSMHFGKPSLEVIHEPVANIRVFRKVKDVPEEEVRRRANRRQVSVEGHWTLWIYDAHWRIVRSGDCLATGNSALWKINQAILDLQGQRINRMSVNSDSGATRCEFDLDTILEVRRRQRYSRGELWLLFGRLDGYQRSIRADGTFERIEFCR